MTREFLLQENHPVIRKILNGFFREGLREISGSLLHTGHVPCASKTTNDIQTTLNISPDTDPAMASSLRSLVLDDSRYQECFKLFLQRSTEHQCMQDFIHKELPDILAR